jgi:hypothetical protein
MELITQQFVCAALSSFGKGEAVRITEVRLFDEDDLAGRLTDMRVWLDQHHYEPSTFTYFFLDPGMKIRVTFEIDREAEAFARKFRGSLLDTPFARGHLAAA